MKLLILTQKVDSNDDNLGFFHRWIEEFARRCERVTVICLYEGMHDLPENVRVLSLGKEEGTSRWQRLQRLYTYVYQERDNYDAVFVHMNQIYILLCGLLWRLWGKRIGLWYAHGSVSPSLRVATMIANVVITSTPQGFRIQSPKKKIVGQGIDRQLFEHLTEDPSGKRRLVSWGRISPTKDYLTMIKAAGRLKDQGIDVCLDIIGGIGTPEQQAYLDSLTKYVREQDLKNVVTFVGPVAHDEIPSHITTCSVFLHASTNGSLDKAALEAMVGSLPVITCNESVASIMPMHLREQLMFSAGDDRALADKVAALLALPREQCVKITTALHDIVRFDHSLDALIPRIIACLEVR